LRGIRLEPNEIQVSLDGNAVGYGIADGSEFLMRVTNVERLVYLTSEQKLGHPYRDRGGPMAEIAVFRIAELSLPLEVAQGRLDLHAPEATE